MSTNFRGLNWDTRIPASDENVNVSEEAKRLKEKRQQEQQERMEKMRTQAFEQEAERDRIAEEERRRAGEESESEEEEAAPGEEVSQEEEEAETEEASAQASEPENKPAEKPVSKPKASEKKFDAQAKKPVSHPPKGKEIPKPDVVQLRDFPASLANHVQRQFTGGSSKSKCLAAYILVMSDFDLSSATDIPDDVRQLTAQLKKKQKTATVSDIYDRLDTIEKKNKQTTDSLRELEVAIAYLLFDRFGFRRSMTPDSPRDLDMLEDGVMDLVDRMRAIGKQSVNEDNIRHGRGPHKV